MEVLNASRPEGQRRLSARLLADRQHAVRAAVVLPLLALAIACGGGRDPVSPVSASCTAVPPSGTVTATVNGEAYTASLSTTATIQNSTVNGPNVIQVSGLSCPVGTTPGRQILFTLGRLTPFTPGTYMLDAASQLQPRGSGYSSTGLVSAAPNLWYAHLSDSQGPGSGSITFTTITDTRLAGTFQVVAVAAPTNAAGTTARMVVTNGAFDVSLP